MTKNNLGREFTVPCHSPFSKEVRQELKQGKNLVTGTEAEGLE